MIKLSRLTDYAIVLLTQMALEGKGIHAASTLAEKTFLPLPTVSKILKQLTKVGVLSAQRGASGGYALTRDPSSISVALLVEAMDGPIAITDCTAPAEQKEGRCHVEGTCPVRANWSKVNKAIRAALDAVSLTDMAAPSAPCHEAHDFLSLAE